MASKPEGYEDSLKSIFDFIFKQAKKEGKLKPAKLEPGSGADMLTQMLAEMAAKPAYYFADAPLEAVNGAFLSQDLIKFYADKIDAEWNTGLDDGGAGRVRVQTKDLGNMISDPRSFFDKAFASAKEERKWAAASGIGSVVDAGVAMGWGLKNGMTMAEARRFGNAAGYAPMGKTSLAADREAFDVELENAAMAGITSDRGRALNAAKEMREIIDGSDLLRSGEVFGSQTYTRGVGKKGTVDRARFRALSQELLNRGYSATEVKGVMSALRRDWSDKAFESGLNQNTARRGLMENYARRAEFLDPNNPAQKTELESLQKSQSAIALFQRVYGGENIDLNRVRRDLQAKMASVTDPSLKSRMNSQIKQLGKLESLKTRRESGTWAGIRNIMPGAGNFDLDGNKRYLGGEVGAKLLMAEADWQEKLGQLSGVTDPAQIARINGEVNELVRKMKVLQLEAGSYANLPFANFRVSMGNIAASYRYYKDVMDGGLGGMILGGGVLFLHPAAPGTIDGRNLFVRDKDGKTKKELFVGVVPRSEVSNYYSTLTGLYYLTPASLLKTAFFNGEGFTYRSFMLQQQMMQKLGSKDVATALQGILGISADEFGDLLGKDPFKLINALSGSTDPRMKSIFKHLSRLEKSSLRMQKIGDLINKNIAGRLAAVGGAFQKGFNSQIAKVLMRMSKNEAWKAAVGKFAATSIGISQLIREGVKIGFKAILHALNISVSGGLLTIVVEAVSWVVIDVGMKAAKYVMQFGVIMLWGLVGLIGLLVFTIFGSFGSVTSSFRHVPPASAQQCVAFNPHTGLYPEPVFEEDGTEYPPSDSSCPLNFSSRVCTQGPEGDDVSTYHQNYKAIDLGTNGLSGDSWTAPTDGQVIEVSPINICQGTGANYGGIVRYRDSDGNLYTIMHVKALVGVGPVKQGTALATSQKDLTPDGSCWTGPHYHLHVQAAGGYVDSLDWYENKLNCGPLTRGPTCHN